MDSRKYFSEVSLQRKALEQQFPQGFCYIVSIHNLDKGTTAGSISQVSVQLAAKALVDSTHELMEADDVLAYQTAETQRRMAIAQQDGASIKRRVKSLFGDNR
jgi:hypothetical protein